MSQTLRFVEVLDLERQEMGEKAPKVTLLNNSQAPISLKRSLSQSCEPHKAYITVELGSFEDTIDRVSLHSLDARKGSLSTSFSYKITSKIPLDTVGLHRFPLEWNNEKRPLHLDAGEPKNGSLGWVIVRVALHGGMKLVTVESPLVLRNISDADLLCEVRDHDGLSVVWRSLIRKQSPTSNGVLSVPVDLVSFLHSDSYLFSAIALPRESMFEDESELTDADRTQFTPIAPPRPFSASSLSTGVIGMRNKKFRVFGAQESGGAVHLNLCSIRIGSFDLEHSLKADPSNFENTSIPESRMLLFRSTVAFNNHLAHPIRIQVKVPGIYAPRQDIDDSERRGSLLDHDWVEIGLLQSGDAMKWSGTSPTSCIELRIQMVACNECVARFMARRRLCL